MKILLTLDGWFPDVCGPNVVITNYAKEILSAGGECRVAVPSYGKKTDAKVDNVNYGFDINRVPSMEVFGYRNALPLLDEKSRELFDDDYDIIHCHSPFGLCDYAKRVAGKKHIPVILTFHTKFRDEFMRVTKSGTLTEFMMKRMMRTINNADYVFTVSDGAADCLREYGYQGDITVIRNGTDMTRPQDKDALIQKINADYNLDGKQNVFLFVGRIESVKNIDMVMRALKLLKNRVEDFTFVVVGDGTYLERLKELAAELKIADKVIFTGMIRDREYLKGFYLRADLFLFPSYFDTASLVPLEAAAFDLPTLLIKDSPTSEVICDGINGYAEIDDDSLWADKIYDIISDERLHGDVRQACGKQVYRTWKDVVAEVMNKYEEIADAK